MAKKTKLEKANKAYAKLEKAAIKFQAAIDEFSKVYEPHAVGLKDWKDDIGQVLEDIDADIADQLE